MENNLAERIKRIRKSKGLSQVDIAEKMNVSDKTVSAWENGNRNPKDIIGLANALQVDVVELIGGGNNNKPLLIDNTGYKLSSKENRSIRFYSNKGFASLVIDGRSGEFMDLYSELDKEDKLYVIENLLDDLEIEDVCLSRYKITKR